jgi:peptide/nickel transport system permease protein
MAALVALALGADFVASDKPLYVELGGEVYVLPNLFDPPALRRHDNQSLTRTMAEGDTAVLPLVPWGYNTHCLDHVLSPPSSEHLLGTDASGRDVLARIVHGARVSLAVGVLAVGVLVLIGVLFGSLAGYYGGVLDALLMRVVEMVVSLPTLLLLATMLTILAPTGWNAVWAMMAVIGLVRWTDVARLIRGEILRIKALDYVDAARALGAGDGRILVRHVIPNALGPVLVAATFGMANAVLLEGALSFLGFGIPADMASWGGLLNGVRGHTDAWWLALFPGLALFLTVTVYNLAGEGLRDALDPR